MNVNLSSRRIHLSVTVEKDVTIPPFTSDDVTLLLADEDRSGGSIVKHNGPTECLMTFQSDEPVWT